MRRIYAAETKVPVERTRDEIQQTLKRYGATHFAYMDEPGSATIAFQCNDRRIRFKVPLPDGSERKHQQVIRQRWRALLLAIKAKLESVQCRIATFEQEFFGFVVDPVTNVTVYESMREVMEKRYLGQENGPLLLSGPSV